MVYRYPAVTSRESPYKDAKTEPGARWLIAFVFYAQESCQERLGVEYIDYPGCVTTLVIRIGKHDIEFIFLKPASFQKSEHVVAYDLDLLLKIKPCDIIIETGDGAMIFLYENSPGCPSAHSLESERTATGKKITYTFPRNLLAEYAEERLSQSRKSGTGLCPDRDTDDLSLELTCYNPSCHM